MRMAQLSTATLTFAIVLTMVLSQAAKANVLFFEDFEDPAVAADNIGALPAGWVVGPGFSQVWHPTGTGRFNQTVPLESPAGGNQLAFIAEPGEGLTSFITYTTNAVIQQNTTYTLSAAIGSDIVNGDPGDWSLQLWADTDGSGGFGSPPDTFIGQMFRDLPGAVNPAPGEWAYNAFVWESGATALAGQNLVILLSNYDGAHDVAVNFDNVTLSDNLVPTPASLPMGLCAVFALLAQRRRR